jgi:hypothetical protein
MLVGGEQSVVLQRGLTLLLNDTFYGKRFHSVLMCYGTENKSSLPCKYKYVLSHKYIQSN